MDEVTLREIIAGLPEKRSRSRLEPFRPLIAEMRRLGRPYREIAQVLGENCQLQVSAAAVHNFVRLHLRRKHSGREDRPRPAVPVSTAIRDGSAGNPIEPKREYQNDEIRRRIEELKRRSIAVEPAPKLFHYNPDEPLHLVPKDQKN